MDGLGRLGGNGRGTGLASAGAAVAPPPDMDSSGTQSDQTLNQAVQELPLRIIGLAFAVPSTSFSSSYEVFIAEKENKGHRELIKLVYWFLPYQPKLTEFHVDPSKMYKLRVTRDRACDESLLHMTVSPEGQAYSGPHLSADSLPPIAERKNMILPCYRTTADDYRKAVGHKR